jgi:hypothetical protein
MSRSSPNALTEELARFQSEVRRLATALAHDIFRQELDRKRAKLPPAKAAAAKPTRAGKPTKPTKPAKPTKPTKAGRAAPAPRPAPEAVAVASPPPPEPTPAPTSSAAAAPANGRKRAPWTRETIVNELASWLASGTQIDATFVTRHGPRGLVAATRRVFGRFDAALNVAALQVEKLYPDGPPKR